MKKLSYLLLGMVLFTGCGRNSGNGAKVKIGEDFTEKISGVELEMVYVKGGMFRMGATEEQGNDADFYEKPVHSVTLSDYFIAKYEVTQELWETVMGMTLDQQRIKAAYDYDDDGLCGVGSDYPVYYVSWNDAQEFCKKLSKLTGKKYALPTEAQWEYAARGGGKSKGYKYSGSNDIGEVAWYEGYEIGWVGRSDRFNGSVHPVGTKAPNELGIYDMSGNIYEWCSDGWGNYSGDAQTNPTGVAESAGHVLRGGCWISGDAKECRVSGRSWGRSGSRTYRYGFRVVLVP